MELIAKNEDLIKLLTGDLTLLSSKMNRIDISNSVEDLVIEVHVELMYGKAKSYIKLKFLEVEEYSFYYNSKHIFYNVEKYKFFIDDGFIYISLDPYDEEERIDANDQDFILSKNVEGYFIYV